MLLNVLKMCVWLFFWFRVIGVVLFCLESVWGLVCLLMIIVCVVNIFLDFFRFVNFCVVFNWVCVKILIVSCVWLL